MELERLIELVPYLLFITGGWIGGDAVDSWKNRTTLRLTTVYIPAGLALTCIYFGFQILLALEGAS